MKEFRTTLIYLYLSRMGIIHVNNLDSFVLFQWTQDGVASRYRARTQWSGNRTHVESMVSTRCHSTTLVLLIQLQIDLWLTISIVASCQRYSGYDSLITSHHPRRLWIYSIQRRKDVTCASKGYPNQFLMSLKTDKFHRLFGDGPSKSVPPGRPCTSAAWEQL